MPVCHNIDKVCPYLYIKIELGPFVITATLLEHIPTIFWLIDDLLLMIIDSFSAPDRAACMAKCITLFRNLDVLMEDLFQ